MGNSGLIVKIKGSWFLIALFSLGLSPAIFAQLPKEKRESPPMEQLPQEQRQTIINYEDEIKKDELPESISISVKENYGDFEITEIYRGSDGSYKIKLKKGDRKLAAYYNSIGEFLRIEEDLIEEEKINDDWR